MDGWVDGVDDDDDDGWMDGSSSLFSLDWSRKYS